MTAFKDNKFILLTYLITCQLSAQRASQDNYFVLKAMYYV